MRPKSRRRLTKRLTRGSRPPFANVELVLPHGMWSQITDYLFRDTTKEYACYVLCGHAVVGRTLRLLGCFLVLPEPQDYESHSLASVRLRRELLISVLQECERHGLSLIDVHSHPFASSHVAFSGVDEADEREKAKWFVDNLPNCFYGSIVLGKESHRARVRSLGRGVIDTELSIRTVEAPLAVRRASPTVRIRATPEFDRHVKAFGPEGQARIGAAHIAIVGLGGLGAALAISLARLGARRFILIDPDRAEPHNLNRLAGMKASDGRRRLKKTRIVNRELLSINPAIRTTLIDASVLSRSAWRTLRSVDLLITATDNHASRMLLNVLSQQYLLPQVSLGALIDTKDGKLEGGYGHVIVMLPGHRRPCLLCSRIVNPVEAYYETASEEHRREAAKRGYVANFDEPAPAVVHLNGVLVNLALVEIHNLFCGFKKPSDYLLYDMFEQEVVHIAEGEQQCATCSPGGGYFGRGDLVQPDDLFKGLGADRHDSR